MWFVWIWVCTLYESSQNVFYSTFVVPWLNPVNHPHLHTNNIFTRRTCLKMNVFGFLLNLIYSFLLDLEMIMWWLLKAIFWDCNGLLFVGDWLPWEQNAGQDGSQAQPSRSYLLMKSWTSIICRRIANQWQYKSNGNTSFNNLTKNIRAVKDEWKNLWKLKARQK